MKLATLKNGTRDGRLVVVSRDLARAVDAAPVVTNLQQAIERWDEVHPALEALSAALNAGAAPMAFAFNPRWRRCRAPISSSTPPPSSTMARLWSRRTTWT
jgi:hypothetical protein